MKKFNFDELIWFIILVFIIFSIGFLIKSGQITNFVSSDMIIYFYISIVILIIFAIFQFSRIFTMKRRVEGSNKFIPITFTLIVGVVLLLGFPLLEKEDNFYNNFIMYKEEDAISITNDNYDLLYTINENKEMYNGRIIVFLGFVNKDIASDYTILCRELVSCCQADKEKIELRVKGINGEIEDGQWVKLLGKIAFDDDFYIESIEYEITKKPVDIYFHSKL